MEFKTNGVIRCLTVESFAINLKDVQDCFFQESAGYILRKSANKIFLRQLVDLFQVAQQITLSLPNIPVKHEGVDLFLANGAAAGQEIFHVHLHVIPRYEGDGFGFRFGPNYMNLPERQELDTIAALIKQKME